MGLAVIIMNENKVLLGKRKGSHGSGRGSFPGGHIEIYETFEQTAKREVKKETNLNIELIDKNPAVVTNDFFEKESKHYVTLHMRAKYIGGEPKIMKANKCEEWGWFFWGNLPQPLFILLQNLIKQKYNPFRK